MPRLPVVSGKELVRLFSKYGYYPDHQTGSHIILREEKEPHRRLTIPNHSEIAKGTLLAILRQAGITREEFMKLLG
jgi:predicted RNA binding protein YcfA (HicA-like mRNA interferase family)